MLIKNCGKVFTMGKDRVLENVDVLIEDGKIKEIGKNLSVESDVPTIDGTDRYVYPGFVDGHCHLGMFEEGIGFEGNDANEMTNPVMPELRAIDAINPMDLSFDEALQGGITSVATGPGSANVIGGQFTSIKTAGNRVDDMVIKEVIGMKCAFGENPKRVYNSKGQTPMTRMATASKLRESLFKAKDYLDKKERAEDDSKKPSFDIKNEALIPVLKGDTPLKAHAHRADDIYTAIRIAKEFNVRLTLEHCTEGHLIADELAKEGYPAIVGPTFGNRSKYELKNKTFDTPKILQEAGVKVAIMTDSPVIPLQHLNLCASLAARAGMDRYEAIKAITINPAEILEISDRVGSLEVGKDADIAIFDGDALDVQNHVLYTIVNGKIVYQK
ncbi:hydroxyatrazine ethylaminohydrolase protein [Haloplasma contractile SSD-17B]|uniref:Hydroxyatrazine ethylaminohydrolase protein n=2 Tax=Haloplasma TaxID=471824 RepID=U2DVR6_9MOLU|nr:amidohydrolase [Haloplasma contractile]ERJ12452.1 hydroxyatrazine ethylaminohydrolase protein [Haloplasma contractile SSD-17B]